MFSKNAHDLILNWLYCKSAFRLGYKSESPKALKSLYFFFNLPFACYLTYKSTFIVKVTFNYSIKVGHLNLFVLVSLYDRVREGEYFF